MGLKALLLTIALAVVMAACGGTSTKASATSPADESKPLDAMDESVRESAQAAARRPPAEREPVEIEIKATRLGNSVRLDVVGIGRFRPAPHPMEQPVNWVVHALALGQMLPRTVNGSVKVQRYQVGDPALKLWDVEVRFAMAYTIPAEADKITVRLTAPESPLYEQELNVPPPAPKLETKAEKKARAKQARAAERRARRKAKRAKARKAKKAKTQKAKAQ